MEDNPYQAPQSDLSHATVVEGIDLGASGLTEAEIRAFVGKNADYYLKKWAPALRGHGGAGFNLAALLLSGLWLGYRKMYKTLIILFAIIAAVTILEQGVAIFGLADPDAVGLFGNLVGLVAAIVCGMYGNAWYLSHTRAAIMEVRATGRGGEADLAELSRRGGTSVASSLGMFFLYLVAMFVIGLVIGLVAAVNP
jgi:hypothetical protein